MLKKVGNSLKGMPVRLYSVAAIAVVIISALAIVGNMETANATSPSINNDVAATNVPNAGALASPMVSLGLTQIYSYEVMYSANTFAPRIWLKNSTAYIGQLIFMPDGAVLPVDNLTGGQVNLYYHQKDFGNAIDLLRNENPVYLLYSGSGPGFENGIRAYPRAVGDGKLKPYVTTTYK